MRKIVFRGDIFIETSMIGSMGEGNCLICGADVSESEDLAILCFKRPIFPLNYIAVALGEWLVRSTPYHVTLEREQGRKRGIDRA